MNKILLVFLLVLGFCSHGLGDSCPWPNGTDKALHWWLDPNNLVTIHDVQLYDANGNPEYPVNLLGQLYMTINLTYTGPAITNFRLDEDIAEWGGFSGDDCKWSDLPTFGLLSNLDACAQGFHCPFEPGNHILQLETDFTNYDVIINLLKNDTPYELTYDLTNKDTGDKIVIHAQARCITQNPTSAPKH
uniref:MD-2-related lipid-recognition domain-containing protein n=1 Tax=Acrobeloides nanus TaxID=290746 RepID=A0A914CA16_9BILA